MATLEHQKATKIQNERRVPYNRRRRQAEGIKKVKEEGKYRGRQEDSGLHEKIYPLQVVNQLIISDTAKLTNMSDRTVIRVATKLATERSER